MPELDAPVKLAIIGAGNRSTVVYQPLFKLLKPWVDIVAVCDPIQQHADTYASALGIKAYTSIEDLVASGAIEAALVVTPIDLHHAISVYLSDNGIHHLVETSMANLLKQAEEMRDAARDNNTIMRVAENFFRYPFDRIAKRVIDSKVIGDVKRVSCFHDHTGYHNNSRWVMMMDALPEYVQAIEHVMPTAPHYEMAHRYRTSETYSARFFFFPEDRLVVDHSGNIKGMLGRYYRPGYTEVNGAWGTLARSASGKNWLGEAELRVCSEDALMNKRAEADQCYPVKHVVENGCWVQERLELPDQVIAYTPFAQLSQYEDGKGNLYGGHTHRAYYAVASAEILIDFALQVRDVRPSEFSDDAAVMSMMMEVAVRESVLQNGERIALPLDEELESEAVVAAALKDKHGVDPMDVQAMLSLEVGRP